MAKSNASRYKRIGQDLYELRATQNGQGKRWHRVQGRVRSGQKAALSSGAALVNRVRPSARELERLKYLPPNEQAYREERRRIMVRAAGTALGLVGGAAVGYLAGKKTYDMVTAKQIPGVVFQGMDDQFRNSATNDKLYRMMLKGFRQGPRPATAPGLKGVKQKVIRAARDSVGKLDDMREVENLAARMAAGVSMDDAVAHVGIPLGSAEQAKILNDPQLAANMDKIKAKLIADRRSHRSLRRLQGGAGALALSQQGLNQGQHLANSFNTERDRMVYHRKAAQREREQLDALEIKEADRELAERLYRQQQEQLRAQRIHDYHLNRSYAAGEPMIEQALHERLTGRSFSGPGQPPRPGLVRRRGPDGRWRWYSTAKNKLSGLQSAANVRAGQFNNSKVGKAIGGTGGILGVGLAGNDMRNAINRAQARKDGKLNDGGGLGRDMGAITAGFGSERVADHFVGKALAKRRAAGMTSSRALPPAAAPLALPSSAAPRVLPPAGAPGGLRGAAGKALKKLSGGSPIGHLAIQMGTAIAAGQAGRMAGAAIGTKADALAAKRRKKAAGQK